MKTTLLLLTATLLCGCRGFSPLVTAKVEIVAGTNRVVVTQPKDTTIDTLVFDPVTGKLRLEGYASAANAAAIASERARVQAQMEMVTRIVDMVGSLSAAAGRAYGLPVGMKAVPKDDPSTPQPEIDPL